MAAGLPDLVILDCDGVLIDSEVISARVLVELAAEHGVRIDESHVARHFVGRSFPTVARAIRDGFAADLPPDFEATYRARLLARFEGELRPMPGAADVLARLAVPFCVATSSSPQRAARSLEIAGLAPLVPRVFTASLVPRGKPAPDLFLHAAAAMGADPARCLVVEDSGPGLEAARAAGMRAILFAGGSHLAGRDAADLADPDPDVPVLRAWSALAALRPALLREPSPEPVP